MEHKFVYSNKIHKITVDSTDKMHAVKIDDGKPRNVEVISTAPNSISLSIDGELRIVHLAFDKDKRYVAIDGDYFIFDEEKGKSAVTRATTADKGNVVVAPMPGLVVRVPVALGDKVTSGTTLAIVEAMKMQNELRAPRDGIVSKINFKEGDQVDALQVVVELET